MRIAAAKQGVLVVAFSSWIIAGCWSMVRDQVRLSAPDHARAVPALESTAAPRPVTPGAASLMPRVTLPNGPVLSHLAIR